eukprot:6175601-Pleurochrysis_carterae.AAC.1
MTSVAISSVMRGQSMAKDGASGYDCACACATARPRCRFTGRCRGQCARTTMGLSSVRAIHQTTMTRRDLTHAHALDQGVPARRRMCMRCGRDGACACAPSRLRSRPRSCF